jgi:hypothetical protein
VVLEHEAWTERLIGAPIEVHRGLRPRFLKSVYEKARIIELKKRQCLNRGESFPFEDVPAFLPSSLGRKTGTAK